MNLAASCFCGVHLCGKTHDVRDGAGGEAHPSEAFRACLRDEAAPLSGTTRAKGQMRAEARAPRHGCGACAG